MSINVPSDLYNRLFLVPVSTPHVEVDYDVMNELLKKLPDDYIIPDPYFLDLMQ